VRRPAVNRRLRPPEVAGQKFGGRRARVVGVGDRATTTIAGPRRSRSRRGCPGRSRRSRTRACSTPRPVRCCQQFRPAAGRRAGRRLPHRTAASSPRRVRPGLARPARASGWTGPISTSARRSGGAACTAGRPDPGADVRPGREGHVRPVVHGQQRAVPGRRRPEHLQVRSSRRASSPFCRELHDVHAAGQHRVQELRQIALGLAGHQCTGYRRAVEPGPPSQRVVGEQVVGGQVVGGQRSEARAWRAADLGARFRRGPGRGCRGAFVRGENHRIASISS